MKAKSLIGVGLVLTTLLSACDNDSLLQFGKTSSSSLTAYVIEKDGSRVEIDKDCLFHWSEDDKISVYSIYDTFDAWNIKEITDRTTATFEPIGSTIAADVAYAVFPVLDGTKFVEDKLTITLPSEYSSNKTAPILIGTYNGGEVNFAHAAALIRVTYTDVPSYASKFILKTKNKITGEFTVDADNTISTETSDDGDAVTIKFSQDEVVDGTITFDIPVPVGEYEFFAAYLLSDEDAVISSKTANAVTINRQDILLMPSIAAASYVVETVNPSSEDDKTYILDSLDQQFDISQVSTVYIDGKKQDEVAYSYAFGDTGEHTVTIVMNENFTNAYFMFYGCRSITSLDLSHLDTSNVTNMSCMLGSLSLTSLDVSHLNTSKVTNMGSMFENCPYLTSLDLSNFDTSNVEKMGLMFSDCSTLAEIKMTGDIKDDVYANYMFALVSSTGTFYYPASKKDQYAKLLDGAGIDGWKQIDIETGDIIKDIAESYVVETVKSSSANGKTCILDSYEDSFKISQVDAVYIDGKKQAEVAYSYAFGDTGEHTVTIVMKENFTSTHSMFSGCETITSLDLSHLDTSNVTDMKSMFFSCRNITSVDLSNSDTSKVTDMREMFYLCYNLVEIKMTGDINDDVDTEDMFYSVPTSGTFYYPASKKEQYAKFFNGTKISGWKQIDIETGAIIKDGDTN